VDTAVISVLDLQNGMDLQQHTFGTRMPRVLVERTEELFPALKENMVSVLCMIGIVSSSLMIAVAGVFDVVVPRQN
jgi:hypothetical protein